MARLLFYARDMFYGHAAAQLIGIPLVIRLNILNSCTRQYLSTPQIKNIRIYLVPVNNMQTNQF